MPKTRKSQLPRLKAKVAVEAIKAHKTRRRSRRYSASQVGGCKKQALAGLPDIFGNLRAKPSH